MEIRAHVSVLPTIRSSRKENETNLFSSLDKSPRERISDDALHLKSLYGRRNFTYIFGHFDFSIKLSVTIEEKDDVVL